MIHCIIVDDQPLSQQLLTEYVLRHPALKLLKVCNNAMEAFDAVHNRQPDLVFLDIQMPSMTGIDFIKTLKDPPAFIFVTAFPEHAVQSYELNAVDYLLKPVTYERFKTSVDKFLKIHLPPEPVTNYTYLKVDGRMLKLQYEDILYAQSVKDYIVVVTTGCKFMIHMTMKYLTNLLPSTQFKRVHRSFLVGILHITSISRDEVKLNNLSIPVGESYRAEIGKMIK